MPDVIYFRGSRDDVVRVALQLQAVLTGRDPDQRIARQFQLAIGLAALSDIKEAFVVKAKGGTDEMGIKWKPLSPVTIANRRVGPGDVKVKGRVGETKEQAFDRVQRAVQIRIRERIRKREAKKALKRFRHSLPEPEARRRAEAFGQHMATKLTGKSKVQTLGARQVEILRDTGVLLNSLSPGTLAGDNYQKPTGDGGDLQIMQTRPGAITVGTTVEYASKHQDGDPSTNLPARPILPDDDHPVPDVWWARWVGVAALAAGVAFKMLLARRGNQ